VGSPLGADGRMADGGRSGKDPAVVVDNRDDKGRRRAHDGQEDSRPMVVHGPLVENGHICHGRRSSALVESCHGRRRNGEDCILLVGHGGHTHPLAEGMGDVLGNESVRGRGLGRYAQAAASRVC
jgi:hypothetical protein